MKPLVPALAAVVTLAAAPAVLAQAPSPGSPANPVISSQTYPGTGGGGPGVPGPEAVNPAPGATGPYIGAGRRGFYDVDRRIADIKGRIGALPPTQRRRAIVAMRAITSEAATQRARHGGELRDWDRENLNHKLDLLIQAYPGLGPDAAPPAQ